MILGVLGAGGVGLGSAALAVRQGHAVRLWSPSLADAPGEILASGGLEGRFGVTCCATIAAATDGADAVLVAVPATAYRPVFTNLAESLAPGVVVLISGMLSFAAAALAALRGGRGTVAGLTTSITAGRRGPNLAVAISALREGVGLASLPPGNAALELATALFGQRFAALPSLVAAGLANVNPINHLGLVLGNFTRIERGEAWPQYHYLTPGVAALIEALDAERRGLARAFGHASRDVRRHFAASFSLEPAELATMAAALHARRGGPPGPATLASRYITEDAPFGLWPSIWLARRAGLPLPLHEAGLALLGALCSQDFPARNDVLDLLDPATLGA